MLNVKKTVEIIGVPTDLGANLRGACMGPAAIRIAGLKAKIEELGHIAIDRGDLSVPIREALEPALETRQYLMPIRDICRSLMTMTKAALDQGRTPLVIGGDHSIGVGTISGVAAHFRAKGQSMGLIWIDAHADVNTPSSSPSGNIHGMPLATILGQGHEELVTLGSDRVRVAPKNVALIGIRMIDMVERELLRASGITYFTMRDIDEKGMTWVMERAIAVASDGTSGIHVSFDLDGVDPVYAPGVSTPVTGGLSFREAHLALEKTFESGKLTSLEFVELNPFTDIRSQTANLCVDLIQSALGKSIV